MARCDQQRRQQAEEEEEEESRCKWDEDCKQYICVGFFFLLAVVSVIAGIIAVIGALREPPDPPSRSMRVHGASASMFELDDNDDDGATTLRYNLDLNVSVCNEEELAYLVYHLVATALYGGVPLGYVALVEPAEPLLLLNTDGCSIPTAPPLRPALFRGETTLPAGSQAAALFRREEGEGMFTIDVHLHMLNMGTTCSGDPEVDGLEFDVRRMDYLGHDTSVKLRRPNQ